jgi:hypothetical protein
MTDLEKETEERYCAIIKGLEEEKLKALDDVGKHKVDRWFLACMIVVLVILLTVIGIEKDRVKEKLTACETQSAIEFRELTKELITLRTSMLPTGNAQQTNEYGQCRDRV